MMTRRLTSSLIAGGLTLGAATYALPVQAATTETESAAVNATSTATRW